MESSQLLDTPLLIKNAQYLAALIAFGAYWLRAGSIHNLLERLWRLLVDKAEVNDARLREYMEEARDLEKFRFIYGIRVSSLARLHRFINWQKENHLGIGEAQKIRHWIDIESPEVLRAPPPGYFHQKRLSMGFGLLLLATALALLAHPAAVMKLKSTQSHVTIERGQVSDAFGQWVMRKEDCLGNDDSAAGANGGPQEKTLACQLLNDAGFSQMVEQKHGEQRLAGLIFAIIGLLFFLHGLQALSAATAARTLHQKLAASTPPADA